MTNTMSDDRKALVENLKVRVPMGADVLDTELAIHITLGELRAIINALSAQPSPDAAQEPDIQIDRMLDEMPIAKEKCDRWHHMVKHTEAQKVLMRQDREAYEAARKAITDRFAALQTCLSASQAMRKLERAGWPDAAQGGECGEVVEGQFEAALSQLIAGLLAGNRNWNEDKVAVLNLWDRRRAASAGKPVSKVLLVAALQELAGLDYDETFDHCLHLPSATWCAECKPQIERRAAFLDAVKHLGVIDDDRIGTARAEPHPPADAVSSVPDLDEWFAGNGHYADKVYERLNYDSLKRVYTEAEVRRLLSISSPVAVSSVQDATTPIASLIAKHAEMLEANPYAYFELAYTRTTDWMAWLCSNAREDDPDRKVLARGQGTSPHQACSQALEFLAGGKENGNG